MDKNIEWVQEKKIKRVIKALDKNNMNGYIVRSKEELFNKIEELVPEQAIVACGGSMTLFETGIIDYLREERYIFLDRYKDSITPKEIDEIYKSAFSADVYFTSTNAITECGELYNVDGTGNRVAAMIFGPGKVIVIAGINKIVKNLDEAIERNKRQAAPANAKRLNKKTPCSKVGYCMECSSEDRICCNYTLIRHQRDCNRIHVIFLCEELGY